MSMGYCNLDNVVDLLPYVLLNCPMLPILFINAIDENQLTGTIPSEIGLLTSMKEIWLRE